MSFIELHASLQLLAFLVFFPLGSIIALKRESIGTSWFGYHVMFQTLGTISVIAAVVFVIAYKRTDHHDHSDEKPSATKRAHRINGYILLSVLAFQWLWAVLFRRFVPWGIWLGTHMFLAALLLVLAAIQITLGLMLFSGKK